jgi:hypothetical protein
MRVLRFSIPAILVMVAASCATGTGGTTARSGPRNELTQAQMIATNTSTVYDAIRRLRPGWLRVRGSTSTRPGAGGILVYMDGVRAGPVDRLQQMNVTSVTMARYVSPNDATTRWGTGHSAGVIEIITR